MATQKKKQKTKQNTKPKRQYKYEKWKEPDKQILLEGWARAGLTDEQIAKNIGISRKTLSEWKKKYGYIGDTLKKGKEIVDLEVENALLKRALGYTTTETKVRSVNGDEIETFTTTKEVPPDVTAIIYWLNNRRSDTWRNKPKEQIDSTVKVVFDDKEAEDYAT